LPYPEETCRRYGTLFIADEIQTGMGRTGEVFAVNHEHAEPDVLILSKSLSGGMVPIGAIVTTDAIWRRAYGTLEKSLLHSSTFGGNAKACACGLAALRALLEHEWHVNAREMGGELMTGLETLKSQYSSILLDVRGKGLMIGLSAARFKGKASLAEGMLTIWMARQLLKRHRILSAFTMNNLDVLRIAPPLLVGQAQVHQFLNALEDVLKSCEKFSFLRLLKPQTTHQS